MDGNGHLHGERGTVKDTHGFPFTPLSVWSPPPQRRPREQISGGRRPVVGVLDTGVAMDHPWFGAGPDGPVVVDASHQWGWASAPDCRFGPQHGTFVAGVIRQAAPDATILSVQLAGDDNGAIRPGEIHKALDWVRQVTASSDPARFVDVVCLAVGFRLIAEHNEYLAEVTNVIRALANRGVLVVTATGNKHDPSDGPVYPAAKAPELADGALPLVAVGATDSHGQIADFTIAVEHMRHRVGVTVFSTTPLGPSLTGPSTTQATSAVLFPTSQTVVQTAKVIDATGFGVGSGTSYAAAGFAGAVAQAMLDDVDSPLDDVAKATAVARANRALQRLQDSH